MATPYLVTYGQPFPPTSNRLRESALLLHYWCELESVAYRTWAPAESPVRIEYSANVLVQLRRVSESRGILFGVRQGNHLRVLAARRGTDDPDTRLAGLIPVGIFTVRVRGEVFLTESDLERFGEAGGSVALVMAGSKGGFFVRETNGSIQAVRSYEEFPVLDRARSASHSRIWVWGLLALSVMLLIARPVPRVLPEAITLRDEAGQLRIGWNPTAVGKQAKLEILDGTQEIAIPISPHLESITYAPQPGDAEVRVFILDENGRPGNETALFVSGETAPSPEVGPLRTEIVNLEIEAATLRNEIQRNRSRIAELQDLLRRVAD